MSRWTIAFFVGRLQTLGGLDGDVERLFQLQGTLGNPIFDSSAFEEGHGEERLPVGLVDLVNVADVWVVQTRSRLRFPDETGFVFGIFNGVRGEELEGDRPFQLGVLSLVNDTHPALAEFLGDLVVRDGDAGLRRSRRNRRWALFGGSPRRLHRDEKTITPAR